MSGEDWWYVVVAEGVRETGRMRNYVRKCRMRKSVWAGRCLGGGGVMSVVWMVPVLVEFLSVFVAMSTVLEAMCWVFVVAGGFVGQMRNLCAKVSGGWRGPRGRVGWPAWGGGGGPPWANPSWAGSPRGRVAPVGGEWMDGAGAGC